MAAIFRLLLVIAFYNKKEKLKYMQKYLPQSVLRIKRQIKIYRTKKKMYFPKPNSIHSILR